MKSDPASPACVLIVDDDQEFAQMLRDFLMREGFAVELAGDGEIALHVLLTKCVDIMLLDVMLPQRSGMDILRELRTRSDLPVIMLTALDQDIERILGLEIGADDYISKPCNSYELAARLRAVLRRTRGGVEQNIPLSDMTIGPVVLRAASRVVTVRGNPIILTATEFNILSILMREAGQVVSKEALSQDVLGRALHPLDRSIYMHIYNVRRKLGTDNKGTPFIVTVQRNGYLFRQIEEE